MAVHLTPSATHRVTQLVEKDPARSWLRLAIQGGGCSGMSYVMEFVAQPKEKDKVFESEEGLRVCIDRRSYLHLNGMEIDWEESLVTQAFRFNNPHATRTCSCGESFSV